MSEHMTPAQGIDLALDPNLLSLPKLPNQSISPINFTGTPSNETTQDTETTNNTEFNSLVNNPFEIYGNMPLSQLVPLILQQKQLTFAQLSQTQIEQDLHDVDNITTTNIPEEETTATVAAAATTGGEDIPEIVTEPQQDTAKTVITGPNPELLDPITLEKIRGTMIEQINIAMNESSLALETVSLLLSSVRENNAKSSLSPYLKRTVPMGSLNGDNVPIGKDITNQLRTVQFGIGWKLKSLEESRNILRDTVDSLWTIMSREHSYWKKISEVITNSDVIFKIRERNSSQRVLGIKYGYEDSGSTYRLDHGIALLRNNEEMNKLELIPFNSGDNKHQLSNNGKNITSPGMRNLAMTTPAGTVAVQNISSIMNDDNNGYYSQLPMKYYLRVRIFTKIEYEDDYILSGESSIDPEFYQIGNIRNQIDKFKDIIFEKELMYQLKKECSTLISYGVRIENENKITIELPQEKFEIELIGVHEDEMDNTMNNNTNGRINDKRANLILITLRMLLVVVFKKNLRRRISNSSDSSEELLLIRPILGKLRHSSYKKLLMRIIQENVINVVKDSTIETINKQDQNMTIEQIEKDKHIEQINKDIKSFDSLLRMPITQFNIQLNNKTSNLEIILRTTNYCNAIIVIKYYNNVTGKIIFDTSFTEFKEIEEFLHFLINEYVIE